MIIALAYSYIVLNFYTADTFEVDADPVALNYYNNTYEESRAAFVSKSMELREHFDTVLVFKTPVESQTDTGLYIDYCFISNNYLFFKITQEVVT